MRFCYFLPSTSVCHRLLTSYQSLMLLHGQSPAKPYGCLVLWVEGISLWIPPSPAHSSITYSWIVLFSNLEIEFPTIEPQHPTYLDVLFFHLSSKRVRINQELWIGSITLWECWLLVSYSLGYRVEFIPRME